MTITADIPVLAIDPGSGKSAIVIYDAAHEHVEMHDIIENDRLLRLIHHGVPDYGCAVIERVACFGMSVGEEVFEMVYFSGMLHEAIAARGKSVHRMYRREVKLHLCNSVKASDSNIRTRLIDIFGGKDKAIGKKAAPGPLHGIHADEWSALAIAVTFADTWRTRSEAA